MCHSASGKHASLLQRTIKPGDKRTVECLKQLLPEQLRYNVTRPWEVVSHFRRFADHKTRPKPERFPAFEEFNKDLCAVVSGLEVLRDWLAQRLKVDLESCHEHSSKMEIVC